VQKIPSSHWNSELQHPGTASWVQPEEGTHPSVVQTSPSSHESGGCVHPVKGLQPSTVHASLSLQEIGTLEQPVAGIHESVVHALPSSHVLKVVWQVWSPRQA
jgi:hypothetical protein